MPGRGGWIWHCHWDVGIRSRGLVSPRRVMKHDVRLRACGRTRRWHVGAAAGTRLATHWSAVRDSSLVRKDFLTSIMCQIAHVCRRYGRTGVTVCRRHASEKWRRSRSCRQLASTTVRSNTEVKIMLGGLCDGPVDDSPDSFFASRPCPTARPGVSR